ncbi:MAG: dihydroorotase family protein [Candidatus Peribacteraceae bacterium]|nr:dihydroorotase family protein [Candidatus Peribacteraceae bacterium]
MKKLLIHGGSVVTDTTIERQDILLSVTGEIEEIHPKIPEKHGEEFLDAAGLLIFPLLIDCHVHFREPGLEHKATMETEARAALAGGVGTVCEMPNTDPPTVTIAALADKIRRASKIAGCVIKFFFGVTEDAHLHALRELWTGTSMELKRMKHHCAGVKVFFDHSTGNQKVTADLAGEVFKVCGELKIPLVAHCEDPGINQTSARNQKPETRNIALHSLMRPPESEAVAIERAIGLAQKCQTPLHIAHLSTTQGVALVRAAKKSGVSVTCEVTPHHLFLTTDDYEELGTLGKMNPPLRTPDHRTALWEGIADGTVDCVATDHAPHLLAEKKVADPLSAPSGVPGVETMLPLLLTVAAGQSPQPNQKLKTKNQQLSYSDIVRLCFTNPNRIFSLGQDGIQKKAHARLVIIDPSVSSVITPVNLRSKCGWTPYEGWETTGKILRTVQ